MRRTWGIVAACAIGIAAHAASRAELKVQLGHSGEIASVAISPDNRRVLTGGSDGARLWDVATGREIRRFLDTTDVLNHVSAVAFSPDGRLVLTGSGFQAILWDLASGREVRRFQGHTHYVESLAFSADGSRIVTGSMDGTARLWDTADGREIHRFEGHTSTVLCVAFSGDGRRVLTGSLDKTARLWDTATGSELGRFAGHTEEVASAAISRDGGWLVTADANAVRRWDTATGQEVRKFENSAGVGSLAVMPDGRTVMGSVHLKSEIRLWDAGTGKEVRHLELQDLFLNCAAISRDGRLVLAGISRYAELLDLATGRAIRRFEGFTSPVSSLAISAVDRYVVAGRQTGQQVWDLLSGGEVHRFRDEMAAFAPDGGSLFTASNFEHSGVIWDLKQRREKSKYAIPETATSSTLPTAQFSADGGRVLLTGENAATLLDAATGKELHRYQTAEIITSAALSPDALSLLLVVAGVPRLLDVYSGSEIRAFEQPDPVEFAIFSPDDSTVFMAARTGDVASLWDSTTGKRIRRLEGQFFDIVTAAFSPDGRYLFTASRDQMASIWEVATGHEVRRLPGVSGLLNSSTFSHDGRILITGGDDGTVQFWDFDARRLLATAISFNDGGWAVVDPEGRYDASDPDNSPALYWQLGDDIVELSQLKTRFYTPNLLARTLGNSSEPLPRVAGLDELLPWPEVQVNQPRAGESTATLQLTDRGGGIGRVVVKVNGREIPLSLRGAPMVAGQPVPVDLSAAQLAAGGDNTIEVIAYDRANLVAGRGVTVTWRKAPANAAAPPVLHAILAGVSAYESPSMSLRFPAKDALDMAHALEIGGKELFGVDGVDIARFASGAEREPTKENIRQAFAAIAGKAGPNDVVLVYLAGHGVAGKAGSDLYYYLTREARSVNPDDDPQLWKQTTISSAELLEWLSRKGMPLRQVVVLDTCAAGAAVSALVKLADRRELTADQRRALELLKDATGSHILMGSAADKVSYEASRYGQGLLTYSLLQGMRGEALDEGGRLDVANWFRTAQREVPELAQGIGGIQQPVISSPGGQTFPIALFTPEDRQQIHLPGLKPQLLRARVEDEDQSDPLQLEEPVRALLRATSIPATRGETRPDPPLVYLDQVAGDVAGAYLPQVRYRVTGGGVEIRLRLVSGPARLEQNFEVASRNPEDVAKRIVAELVRMLAGAKQN
jgi:WD40 repeat protein/uncharacterized caspase-like protein